MEVQIFLAAMICYAVFANGELTHLPTLKSYRSIIAVDGGLRHLKRLQITPDLIIGDFDSVAPHLLEEYSNIPKQCFPKDKDFSDLELAIDIALKSGAEKITIFGALGGPIDHTLANLMVLLKSPERISIESEQETLSALTGTTTFTTKPGQVISLLPLGNKAERVTTHGLKWEIQNKTIDNSFFSLSNVAVKEAVTVTIQSGALLLACKGLP